MTEEQRRFVRRGVRYARLLGSQFWFDWAKTSIAHGDIVTAAEQGRHALVELIHFWLDRAQ